jgi:uncharacterized membrane protein YhiD involved in acid resistance
VAAQIVTGIGFLGAGVIMKQGLSVTGLNTAATLWGTGAVGALAGAWMWRESIAGAAIIIAGNGFLHPLAARMDRLHFQTGRDVPLADYVVEVVCRADAESAVRASIIQAVSGPGVQLTSLRSTDTETPGEIALRAEMSAAAEMTRGWRTPYACSARNRPSARCGGRFRTKPPQAGPAGQPTSCSRRRCERRGARHTHVGVRLGAIAVPSRS